jgi:hypothetical protein
VAGRRGKPPQPKKKGRSGDLYFSAQFISFGGADELRAKLHALAKARRTTVSEALKQVVDEAYEALGGK